MGLIAWFKGLSLVAKVVPWLGWIGGPIGGIISALVGLVVGFFKKVFRGIMSILENPIEVIALVTCVGFAFAVGIHYGHKWTSYKVERANARVETVLADLRGQDNEDSRKAAAAIKARLAAERSVAGD